MTQGYCEMQRVLEQRVKGDATAKIRTSLIPVQTLFATATELSEANCSMYSDSNEYRSEGQGNFGHRLSRNCSLRLM